MIMKRLFIFLLSAILSMSVCSQTIIPFKAGANTQTLQEPTLTQAYQNSMMQYTFSAENMSLYTEYASDNNMYEHLYMKAIGQMCEVGKAELPAFYDYVPVMSKSATVTLLGTDGSEMSNMDIWPFQQPKNISDSTASSFYRDSIFYNTNAYYPNNPVEILEYQTIGDRIYAFIRVCPIQYNPVMHKLRCFTEVNYAISNYYIPSVSSEPDDGIIRTQEDYLIVCNDSALDAVSDFVKWKEMQGFNVHVIHSNNWSTFTSVRDSVRSYYNKCNNCCYLLVAGDYDMVPAEKVENVVWHSSGQLSWGDTTRYASDYSLSCRTNNSIPQIAVGRIPSDNVSELSLILDKLIRYQRTPKYEGKALHCAFFEDNNNDGFEDNLDVRACEEIKSFIEQYGNQVDRVYYAKQNVNPLYYNKGFSGGPLPAELLKPVFPWDGNKYQIIDGINSNPNIVLYSGHGSPRFWDFLDFSTADVPLLSNTIYPIVLSMACLTGKYVDFTDAVNSRPISNLAYSLLRSFTGGASAVIASTELVTCVITEIWTMCLFDSLFPDKDFNPMLGNKVIIHASNFNHNSIGVAMLNSFSKLKKNYSSSFVYNIVSKFHCFGDPSTELYTNYPEDLSAVSVVQINDSIIVDTRGIQDCSILLIPKDEAQSNQFMRVDSITGRYVFPNITTTYNVSIQKHNSPLCYYDSYDVFLQNIEFTNGQSRRYEGRNVYIGSNVTTDAEQGHVIVHPGARLIVKGHNSVKINKNVIVEVGGTFKEE